MTHKPAMLLAMALALGAGEASAQTLIEEWDQAKLPPAPALKPANIVPAETALLVMDFTRQTCTA